jgi:hypothetical protein
MASNVPSSPSRQVPEGTPRACAQKGNSLWPRVLAPWAFGLLLATGCTGESTALPGDNSGAVVTGDGGNGVSSDLPCPVADLLIASCVGCHSNPPANGAPQALNSLAALQAASPGYPSESNGQRAVVRMALTSSPMPPSPNPAVPADEQTAFADWVDAGMPAGSCSSLVDAGTVTVDPVFAAAPTCTSGQYWTSGDGTSMRPGEACIACHSKGEGPRFTVAGTVYPTGHEYNDCDGKAAAGAVVTVTDSKGVSASFNVNGVGNFSGNASLTLPVTAVVSVGGSTRAMTTAVPSGDCNSCHTQTGANNAPGRIALP